MLVEFSDFENIKFEQLFRPVASHIRPFTNAKLVHATITVPGHIRGHISRYL